MKKGMLVLVTLLKGTKTSPVEKTKIEKVLTGETVTLKIEDDIFHDAKEFLGEEKIFAYYRDGEKFCLVVDERADLEKLSGKHEKYSYTKKTAK